MDITAAIMDKYTLVSFDVEERLQFRSYTDGTA